MGNDVIQLPDGVQRRHGDERGFIHKKLLSLGGNLLGLIPGGGAVKTGIGLAGGIISRRGGGAVAAGTGVWSNRATGQQVRGFPGTAPREGFDVDWSFAPDGAPVAARPLVTTTRPSAITADQKRRGREFKGFAGGAGAGNGQCNPPLVWDPQFGRCRPAAFAGDPGGGAVMGQYGAALIPGSMIIDRQVCLRGMQLGNDGLCYNKSQISNKQRMWPAGRKPLLTGGQMNAISIAARAGRRLELATKRLQKMGMMRKPARRAQAPRGHVARLEHASGH